ncbi:putative F-box/FBD/LRR-repeat protein At5g52460 [Durio zibethinus]|uniref:F-box/FBD/LRR-repeat protein At5g52460 n=1 Tax=Durio zibethinus TaxID=66656 RepID=A0A6P5YA33_DURZI|nr:putative F-box/FBD/LRR-repeat protein At5g52460 [Durio zibethinus]
MATAAATGSMKIITRPNEEESIDRISSLPDDILRHILSFLSSHYSIPTSILSKTFRYIWRILRVKSISSVGGNTLNKLLSGCPWFEIFHIEDCLLKSSRRRPTREVAIKKLYLEYQLTLKPRGCRIQGDSYCANRVLSLASASIDVIKYYNLYTSDTNLTFHLLKAISIMVKQLENESYDYPPILQNLTHLVVKVNDHKYASKALHFLLEHSPNLISLVLGKPFPRKYLCNDMWNLPPIVSKYLETVQIMGS